ncbi:MAG: aldose 1-epimerase family protein [bacterium]|nr:aldose 1-epimerase family protein [bacterium]
MSRYEAGNGVIKIEVDSFGAELRSLRRVSDGREYMWNADPKYWKRTSPVLFPLVGSLQGGQYTYEGKTYAMSQHGFARDMEFTLIGEGGGQEPELWFELRDSEESRAHYPFPFLLRIGYVLEGAGVKVHWQVENTGGGVMHFSIGGHPAFLCPIDGDAKQSDCWIGFDTDRALVSTVIGRDGLASERKKTYALAEGILPINEHLFDEDALIIEHDQAHRVSLMTKDKKPYLTVSFDAPLFGVWSPPRKNAPFICIEPWYGRCDAENFHGTLKEREWGNVLAPGERFASVYTIEAE